MSSSLSTPPRLIRSSWFIVLQYGTLAFSISVLGLLSLNVLTTLTHCALVEIPTVDGTNYVVNIEESFKGATHQIHFATSEVQNECSCNSTSGLAPFRLRNNDYGKGKNLGFPELQINLDVIEYCTPEPSDNCVFTDVINFPPTYLVDNSVTAGFSNYRSHFVYHNVLDFERVFSEGTANDTIYDPDTRLPIITRQELPNRTSREWWFINTREALKTLRDDHEEQLEYYEGNLTELMRVYNMTIEICDFNSVWPYTGILVVFLTCLCIFPVTRAMVQLFMCDRVDLLPQEINATFLSTSCAISALGAGFFSGTFSLEIERVVSIILVVLSACNFLICSLRLYLGMSNEAQVRAEFNILPGNITYRIMNSVKRYVTSIFVISTSVLSILVFLGIFVECQGKYQEGPVIENEKNYIVDYEEFLFDYYGNEAFILSSPGCSCSETNDFRLKQTDSGEWYFRDPQAIVPINESEFCGTEPGCFVLDQERTFIDIKSFINWLSYSTPVERLSDFKREIIDPVEKDFLGSIDFLKTMLETYDDFLYFFRRNQIGTTTDEGISTYRYLFINTTEAIEVILRNQEMLVDQFHKRNQDHLDDFQSDTLSCNPEFAFRQLTFALIGLTAIQTVFVFCLVGFQGQKEGVLWINTRSYVAVILFDSLMDIIYIGFLLKSLFIDFHVEALLNLILLVGNIMCDFIAVCAIRQITLQARSLRQMNVEISPTFPTQIEMT
jgi:hypothetical protein